MAGVAIAMAVLPSPFVLWVGYFVALVDDWGPQRREQWQVLPSLWRCCRPRSHCGLVTSWPWSMTGAHKVQVEDLEALEV